jgi:hypothetical protein
MSYIRYKIKFLPQKFFTIALLVTTLPAMLNNCESPGNKLDIQNTKNSVNTLTFRNWTPFCDKSSIVYIFNGSELGSGFQGREKLMFSLGGLPAGAVVVTYPATSHDFPLGNSWDGLHDSFNPAQDLFFEYANLFEQKKIKLSICESMEHEGIPKSNW